MKMIFFYNFIIEKDLIYNLLKKYIYRLDFDARVENYIIENLKKLENANNLNKLYRIIVINIYKKLYAYTNINFSNFLNNLNFDIKIETKNCTYSNLHENILNLNNIKYHKFYKLNHSFIEKFMQDFEIKNCNNKFFVIYYNNRVMIENDLSKIFLDIYYLYIYLNYINKDIDNFILNSKSLLYEIQKFYNNKNYIYSKDFVNDCLLENLIY